MKVTFIQHSCFMVEMEKLCLLFDYTEGRIPAVADGKTLLVFASHRHGDHYSPKIFELREHYCNIRYILSDDIWRKRLPEDVLNVTDSVGPEKTHTFLAGGETVSVSTYKSTDEGVAFLVSCEGKKIYHAGDLNNWTWLGESDSWNKNMARDYRRELDRMAGQHVDVAFLPLDPRQEEAFCLGVDEFLSQVEADVVFPMHCWGDFSVIGKIKTMDCSESYRDKIVDIRRNGQEFEVEA